MHQRHSLRSIRNPYSLRLLNQLQEMKDEVAGFVIRKYSLSEGQFVDCGSVAENREEMFQLCLGGDGKDLIASVVEGFVIWPLAQGGVSGTVNHLRFSTHDSNL